jgi:hypothetical protein
VRRRRSNLPWEICDMSQNVTEEEAIPPDRAAEVLLKGMSSEKHFSLPERRKYFLASSPLGIVPTLLL